MLDALQGKAGHDHSIGQQNGVTPAALAKSMARVPAAAPLATTDLATATGPKGTASASVIGAALDLLREFEASGTE